MSTALILYGHAASPSAWPDDPSLTFLTKYVNDFTNNFDTTPPEQYFDANCRMYLVDGSTMEGSSTLWSFFKELYSRFPRVTREFLSLITSPNESGFRIHLEVITTTLHLGHGKPSVDVPQSFVYTIGSAVCAAQSINAGSSPLTVSG